MVAACGGTAKPATPVAGPAIDERTAESDARGLIAEIYRTLRRGQTDSLFSLVTDPLIVFGPRRADAMATRADALVALGAVLDPDAKKPAKLKSSGLAVAVSAGGHSAWAFDLVDFDGHSVTLTAVLSSTDDLWAVTAAALAIVPTGRQVKAESARDAIVPPGATAAARVDPAAEDVALQFKRGLVDPQQWGDDLMSRSDAIVAGPAAGQIARGKQAIARLWKSRQRANVREAISGDVSAQVTPDGQLAWLSAPVTRVADGEDPLPLRIFAVYERDGAAWKLSVLHEALAIDEPGSGAAYKKILPPAPEPPEAPKVEPTSGKPDAATDKAKVKKKKTKKRKPRARRGEP